MPQTQLLSLMLRPKQLWLQYWGNHQKADLSHHYLNPRKDDKSKVNGKMSNTLQNIGQALARNHTIVPHGELPWMRWDDSSVSAVPFALAAHVNLLYAREFLKQQLQRG